MSNEGEQSPPPTDITIEELDAIEAEAEASADAAVLEDGGEIRPDDAYVVSDMPQRDRLSLVAPLEGDRAEGTFFGSGLGWSLRSDRDASPVPEAPAAAPPTPRLHLFRRNDEVRHGWICRVCTETEEDPDQIHQRRDCPGEVSRG